MHQPDTVWAPGVTAAGTVIGPDATPSPPARAEPTSSRSTPKSARVPVRHVLMVTVMVCPGVGVSSSTVRLCCGGG